MLAWMAWTWQTGIFFGLIALALAILTLLAIFRPQPPRRAFSAFRRSVAIASSCR